MPGRELVETIASIYPKFDKSLLSKCENGEVYGVQLRQKAMNALYDRFDPQRLTKSRRRDTHRLTCCIRCRLPDELYRQLQQLIRAEGYGTTQDWLSAWVRAYVKERTEAHDPDT